MYKDHSLKVKDEFQSMRLVTHEPDSTSSVNKQVSDRSSSVPVVQVIGSTSIGFIINFILII